MGEYSESASLSAQDSTEKKKPQGTAFKTCGSKGMPPNMSSGIPNSAIASERTGGPRLAPPRTLRPGEITQNTKLKKANVKDFVDTTNRINSSARIRKSQGEDVDYEVSVRDVANFFTNLLRILAIVKEYSSDVHILTLIHTTTVNIDSSLQSL